MERFWSKVDKTSSCWLWTAATQGGYGVFGVNGKTVLAHRWVWKQERGPIPPGAQVKHYCNTNNCVNPKHLYLSTREIAYEDMPTGPSPDPHIPMRKLSLFIAREIRTRYRDEGVTQASLAQEYGVSTTYIWQIINYRIWLDSD
jgi:hypothetical protein